MRDAMIPVVIGDDSEALLLAREICGGEVHIFAERIKLRTRLRPYVRFHRVSGTSPEIISMYICSFVGDNPEYTVTVFGCTSDVEPYIEHSCIVWRKGMEL